MIDVKRSSLAGVGVLWDGLDWEDGRAAWQERYTPIELCGFEDEMDGMHEMDEDEDEMKGGLLFWV